MTRLRPLLLAGTIVVGALAALPSRAAAEDVIRALAPTWPGFAPVFVAMDKGYFKDLGLEVEFSFEDDRANVLAAMARGDIEVDMRTVGEHQGRPRVDSTPGIIIGTIDKSVGGDGVIADGSITAVADLKGKTVAVEPNIPARLLLQLALKKDGLSLSDLKVVEIATADTVAIFADSSISAIGSYEPFMSQAITNMPDRKGKLLVSSKDSDIIVDVITAREDDLAANPQKYANFLTGIYKAVALYESDPDAFIALAAPHYNLSEAEVKGILDTSLGYTNLAEARTLIGTKDKPGTLTPIFDTVMELNVENGAAEAPLEAAKEIDPSALALVRE
ncbi:aliphatic sulfonate ABC transporter substrate-binding protein [Aureimonas sp. SA4125]|uniref:ABC transporter substrate-binding protein n=1 Tax=Aureimonas sp. SA4125 TaxID=2826993 RepID=UPI001CC54385|nr:ABC transporter substrate-binding protein [Aureimonas sp. SA4125]BDA84877.1 aliphatic sulfonate ABC transporter substrate-binding protein [Aureimonas sp. SA4125]